MATLNETLARAAELREAAEESFARSDTDGFLSQWAFGIEANRLELEAEILRNGGKAEFPALFNLEGVRVPAKLITVPNYFAGYGTRNVWAIVDPATGKFTGEFVNPSTGGKRSIANMAKKGYVEGEELAPAKAVIAAAVVRADRGW